MQHVRLGDAAACGMRAAPGLSTQHRSLLGHCLARESVSQFHVNLVSNGTALNASPRSVTTSAVLAPYPELTRQQPSTVERPTVHVPVGAVAYEMVQGALVRYCSEADQATTVPTVVMLHGVCGSRRNMHPLAQMIVEGFPSWQVLLVDLRCHGESASLPGRATAPHSVNSAADDVLALLRKLRIFPRMLIGHSFGGKVAMSMVSQFGQRMPRPVQVWVLDALPGEVRAGGQDGKDHPGRLIQLLLSLPMPAASRGAVIDAIQAAGFSQHIARWAVTNLRNRDTGGGATWSFDLNGIAELYRSYEETSLWPLLEAPPQGLKLDFVRAERSSFKWGGSDQDRITAAGHAVHLLRNAGHWVHTDNPMGLFDLLAPTLGTVDLHLQHPPQRR